MMLPTLKRIICLLFLSTQVYSQTRRPQYRPEGCLRCGEECLMAAQQTIIPCVIAGFGEATESMFSCVKESLETLSVCRDCLESLACCVTDTCSLCDCQCSNLLQFSAPLSSPTRIEQPWLFHPKCPFAYIGNPACKDCDGKRVYQSVDCSKSMYLHYHDYLLNGRWVLTASMDSNDRTAVVRNKGDGFDDEECPERETTGWEMRSKRAPEPGWWEDKEVRLLNFNIT